MGLSDIQFELEYRNFKKDVVKEFYEPALNNAISYKRAVGFFSSTSLIDISYGLSHLIDNGGIIQLVASPRLSEEDLDAIRTGYEKREEIITNALLKSWEDPINKFQEKRLNLLANYIANGKLDIKIAMIHGKSDDIIGIFHEKLGLISDGNNTLAFSGSLNETKTGFYYNYETIDVYCDWVSEESLKRVSAKQKAFDNIWNNTETNLEVLDFPNVILDKIETYNKLDFKVLKNIDDEEFEELNESIYEEKKQPLIPPNFNIRGYQAEAFSSWKENSFQGIFDMATGTGKTYTALYSISKLYEEKHRLAVLISCPFQHLVEQWVDDIKYFGMEPIICYSSATNKNYKKNLENAIFSFRTGASNFLCAIFVNATFRTDSIQAIVSKLRDDVLLVVDEAHNFGSFSLQKTLNPNYKYRLALSATLERHHDEEGTESLYNYFGSKCIEYDLERAINESKLTHYDYFPVIVNLTDEELIEYRNLTKEIGKCIIVGKNGKQELSTRGKQLAIKRARIVAGASMKVEALYNEIKKFKNDDNMLVYCGATTIDTMDDDDSAGVERQIDVITEMLGDDLQMRVSQFTSRESTEQRNLRLRHFKDGDLQALVAIKCLDEGINVPNIKRAFILASTTNPKEYIQRRGRVLRLAPGKDKAEIYDFITLPMAIEEASTYSYERISEDSSLVENEIRRMQEFKRLASNPDDSDELISTLIDLYHLYNLQIV